MRSIFISLFACAFKKTIADCMQRKLLVEICPECTEYLFYLKRLMVKKGNILAVNMTDGRVRYEY